MTLHGPSAELIDQVRAVLAGDDRVEAAWAFGSRARGQERPSSDLDVAVLPTRPLSLREELALRADLAEVAGSVPVDLVLLDRAPPLLRYEVVREGYRLVARDPEAADAYERRAAMACFDTAWLRETQQRLLREAARR